MALFNDTAEFEEMISGFFRYLAANPVITDRLLASAIVIRFRYTEPDAIVVVDCAGDEIQVKSGDAESPVEVEMSMAAEIAHRFWFGKVNLTKALARREIVAKGPIPKILKLLPAIRPAYELYPQYLRDHGYEHLIIT
jgi:hypothetical protein